MIEVYKIITGKYQGVVAPRLERDDVSVTRGNELRLKKFRVRYDLRIYSFRVVNIWNSLVCLIKLCWLIRLTVLSHDYTNFGRIRKLYIILELKLKEPEPK